MTVFGQAFLGAFIGVLSGAVALVLIIALASATEERRG